MRRAALSGAGGCGTVAVVLIVALLAAAWAPPASGGTVEPFAFDPVAPYVANAHRGLDLGARPGELVRAPCAGRVSFAGRVPGHGRAVTLRCGRLAATVLGLRAVRVRRGEDVGRGHVVGAASGGAVHLGARRAGERHGYLDPSQLLAADRGPGGVPALVPRRQAPPPAWRPVQAPVPAGLPIVVWTGLALLAAGTPVGALVARRRRRRSIASARRWPST